MKRLFTYFPTILVAGTILYLSLLREPHFRLPTLQVAHIDKVAHLLMYCGLALVLTHALIKDGKRNIRLHLTAVVPPIIYGGLIEILQERYFYPRTGDWWDWFADIIGVFIGYLLILSLCRKQIC